MSRNWERKEPKLDTRPFNTKLPPEEPSLRKDMQWYLASRMLSVSIADQNMWYISVKAGDNNPRIVIPATSMLPGNVYYQARAIVDVPDEARYLSPWAPRGDAIIVVYPDPNTPVVPKVVVAEGPMDALAAATIGCLGIAFMGMSPPNASIALAVRYFGRGDVYLIADNDAIAPMQKIMLKCIGMGSKATLHLTTPAPSKDFAEADIDLRYSLIGEK